MTIALLSRVHLTCFTAFRHDRSVSETFRGSDVAEDVPEF